MRHLKKLNLTFVLINFYYVGYLIILLILSLYNPLFYLAVVIYIYLFRKKFNILSYLLIITLLFFIYQMKTSSVIESIDNQTVVVTNTKSYDEYQVITFKYRHKYI